MFAAYTYLLYKPQHNEFCSKAEQSSIRICQQYHIFPHKLSYKANSAFHPTGVGNEYQLWLGRLRQVWFIPLADVRGVCR